MILRYTVAFIVIALISWGIIPAHKDKAFLPYTNSFSTTYNINLDKISIIFVNNLEDANWIGVCYMGAKVILIRRTSWYSCTEAARISLIYHELGHCALNRDHDTSQFPDNCPNSFMYPTVNLYDDTCYNRHSAYWFDELGIHK